MSNSSLYGTTGNVTVSSKNLTTLYNSNPTGTVTTDTVTDTNFTTLYSKNPSQVQTSKSYGNANVESFLNLGTDGANLVDNIVLHGNITVGQQSYLGPAGNVHITGGTLNYVLATDGSGNLSWMPNNGETTITDYIHFDVVANGTGQTFTNALIEDYGNVNQMSVMKNGVNLEPSYYDLSAPDTLTVNVLLATGDTIDILPSGHGLTVGGNITEVQYNGGNILTGNSSFTFDQSTSTLTVGNISLSTVDNLHLGGGTNGQVIKTDGAGNLSFTTTVLEAVTVTGNAQPNITSVGTLTSLTVSDDFVASGNVTVQRAFEKFTPNAVGSTGVVNYDVLDQSIVYKTANATGSFTINVRGNSSVTLDSILPVNESITIAYLNTVGSIPYNATNVQIDGTLVTVKYSNGLLPSGAISLATQSYTYTILKTAANTYSVLGSFMEYN